MPIITLDGKIHEGEVVGFRNGYAYVWPENASYFTVISVTSYIWIDYGSKNRDKFYQIFETLYKVSSIIRKCKDLFQRQQLLYPGDVVYCNENEQKLTYVGPNLLKDSFGNHIESGDFRKVKNGPKAPRDVIQDTELFELITKDAPMMVIVDEMLSRGDLTDEQMPTIMEWLDNGHPIL